MAIVAQVIIDGVSAEIDAQGSQRWLVDLDYVPALNNAQKVITGYLATAYAERRISEESLRELIYPRIWQTNQYGRVHINEGSNIVGVPTFIWGITAVYGEPGTIPATPTITPTAPEVSLYRGDVSWDFSGFPAKRLSTEEIGKARNNSFAAGNELMAAGPNRTYSYCIIGNARSTSYPIDGWEIEIAPKSRTSHKLVCIAFLKTPNVVVDNTSTLEFPTSLTDLLIKQTCKELSVKAGDGDRASLYNVTSQMVIDRLSSAT